MALLVVGVAAVGGLLRDAPAALIDGGTSLQATLDPTDRTPTDAFPVVNLESGVISTDGSTAIIGAPTDGGRGAAWIYVRNGNTWTEQAKISAPSSDSARYPLFARSLALTPDGNTAFISDLNNGSGSVWVYTRSGMNWSQAQQIDPPDSTTEFGWTIAISGDGNTAVITALNNDGQNNGAWIYVRSGTSWVEQQHLGNPADEVGGEPLFGVSATLSRNGDTLIVGGTGDDSFRGAYWIYSRTGTTWSEQQKLTPPPGSSAFGNYFGRAASLSGDGNTAAVFAGDGVGVYSRDGANWTATQRLALANDAPAGASVGGISPVITPDSSNIFADGFVSDSPVIWRFTRSSAKWNAQDEIGGSSATPAARV